MFVGRQAEDPEDDDAGAELPKVEAELYHIHLGPWLDKLDIETLKKPEVREHIQKKIIEVLSRAISFAAT